MFMFHENQDCIGQEKKYGVYAKNWRGVNASSASEVAKIVSTYVASNCLWANGVRLKKNFRLAEWLGLDIDDGMKLNEALEIFESYLHVIGTTRSHQKEKKGVTCDRFRIFLKLSERCTNRNDLELTASKWIKSHGADRSCVDAARMFMPCKEIISVKFHGKTVPVEDSIEHEKRCREFAERKARQYKQFYRDVKAIPGWVNSVLKFGTNDSRNSITYRIAKDLSKTGYTEEEIISMIMSSQVPLSNSAEFSEAECRKAVQSALK